MEINTKESRLNGLTLEIDFILQRLERLKEIQAQKYKEMIWLKEVIQQEEQKALAIKEEYQAITRTKGGTKET